MEVFKILKLRQPISLFDQYTLSNRKETTIITSYPTSDFTSRSTSLWNTIAPKLKLYDYSHKISHVKSHLKNSLLTMQHAKDKIEWLQDDIDVSKLSFIKSQRRVTHL